MRVLLQRVISAKVVVDDLTVGEIDKGILVFLAVEKPDTEEKTKRMAHRVLKYRLFADTDKKMNLNVQQVEGGVELRIKLSHQDLASIIGSTRETVTVVLGELQSEGRLLLGRRKIVLTDMAQLAASVNVAIPKLSRA